MSRAKSPFSAWGFGERPRCDHCGNFKSLPGSRVSPQHKPDCKWKKEQGAKKRKAALRLLGITEKDVQEIRARKKRRAS